MFKSMDASERFRAEIANVLFHSFAEFSEKLNIFQKESGFMFRKRDAIKLPFLSPDYERLVYKRVYYVCIHYGSYKSTSARPFKYRTIRCDCPSAFYLLLKDNFLTVKTFRMIHNHPPEPTVVKRRKVGGSSDGINLRPVDVSVSRGHGSYRPNPGVVEARRKRLSPLINELKSLLLVR
uniref:FLYWCH-type domain-containing protein n=1 Tax=Mesocestoides corti TaxID=53468 RepID=A0A5K3ELL8_MESCO